MVIVSETDGVQLVVFWGQGKKGLAHAITLTTGAALYRPGRDDAGATSSSRYTRGPKASCHQQPPPPETGRRRAVSA